METKDKLYLAAIGVLVILLIWLNIRIGQIQKQAKDQTDELKKSIIESDRLIQESNGSYVKLVDYYTSEKELLKDLKKDNKDLYKTINGQGEKILSLTKTIVTLREKIDTGFGKVNSLDTNKIDLKLTYPTSTDPFIKWTGSVNKRTTKYDGAWTFGKLPISIIVTEETRGLWKERIIGPDWFIVDSINVKSLPPEEYVPEKERNIQLLVGGGYYTSKTGFGSVGVGFGVNILKNHNIIIGTNTKLEFGIQYYYKFLKYKKKK